MSNLLKKHAKSFYWASVFLSKETFNKCSSLYNFCRTLDDIVDDNKMLDAKQQEFLNFKKNFHRIAQLQLGIYGDPLTMNQYNIESIFF